MHLHILPDQQIHGPKFWCSYWCGNREKVIFLNVCSSVADPWHFGVDPDPDPRIHASDQWIRIRIRIRILDPDPSIFVIDLQDARKKTNFCNTIFSACDFLKQYLHIFSKIKIQKESQNSRNQGFSYYFCMVIEGSGYGSRAGSGSGSIPLSSGSGSWRPNNTWIRWIQIRIRICNTGLQWSKTSSHLRILLSHQIHGHKKGFLSKCLYWSKTSSDEFRHTAVAPGTCLIKGIL